MGEIADMMIEGTLCGQCGVFLGADFYSLCSDCQRHNRESSHAAKPLNPQCPICSHRKKGLADHMRDKHGVQPALKLEGKDHEE